jgi:hypothetical protein
MAWIIAVVADENGNAIGNGVELASSIFPNVDDRRSGFLRFVDPYGDTLFNRLQIPLVLSELQLLKKSLENQEQQALVQQIESLCTICLDEPHRYLKFIGD